MVFFIIWGITSSFSCTSHFYQYISLSFPIKKKKKKYLTLSIIITILLILEDIVSDEKLIVLIVEDNTNIG